MDNSSAGPVYSITLDDTITLTSTPETIVLSDINMYSNNSTITVTGGGTGSSTNTIFGGSYIGDTITLNDWVMPCEWENSFPDWDRIQKMCETYPGLKIAFEKFKTTYYLVKDDYDTPKDQK